LKSYTSEKTRREVQTIKEGKKERRKGNSGDYSILSPGNVKTVFIRRSGGEEKERNEKRKKEREEKKKRKGGDLRSCYHARHDDQIEHSLGGEGGGMKKQKRREGSRVLNINH